MSRARDLADLISTGNPYGRYKSKTISTNTTLVADTHYLTGKAMIINNGITLIIPVDTLVEIQQYTAGKAL